MPFDSATAFRRQRREDERDKRLRDGPWADLQTRYHQWHRDGHEECRVYGQQRHKRDCEAEVGAGAFHEPWQERFTCLATKQNGADRVWALGGNDNAQNKREDGRRHEIQYERYKNEPQVSQWRENRIRCEAEPCGEHAPWE
jgi:hypothetical protein